MPRAGGEHITTRPAFPGAAGRTRSAGRAVRLLGRADVAAAGWRAERPPRPARRASRAGGGRRVRAGAARGPRPCPPRPGHVGVRRPRRRGGSATAAPRRPDGAAARAAVRRGHRAGLRLPHRPQSHLQVPAGERADPGFGQGGAAAGPPPFPEAVLLRGLGQNGRRGLEGRGRPAAPYTRCGRAASGTGIPGLGDGSSCRGPPHAVPRASATGRVSRDDASPSEGSQRGGQGG